MPGLSGARRESAEHEQWRRAVCPCDAGRPLGRCMGSLAAQPAVAVSLPVPPKAGPRAGSLALRSLNTRVSHRSSNGEPWVVVMGEAGRCMLYLAVAEQLRGSSRFASHVRRRRSWGAAIPGGITSNHRVRVGYGMLYGVTTWMADAVTATSGSA